MKFLLTLISIAVICSSANATVRIVTCQNSPSHFLPDTVNAVVGDTIHWTWVAGNHVVGPIILSDIPSGAATFNAPIDASHLSFEYVVTVAGNYHYACHPASPHGEDAYISVAGSTGISQYNGQSNLASVYPNPSNGTLEFTIDDSQLTKDCSMKIYNLQGQLIFQSLILNVKSFIDLSNQSSGVYYLKFYNGLQILTKKIIIQ
jgi:plastocyanin